MERVILFNLIQVLATAYAVVRGGAPERIAGVSLLVAALSTRLVQQALPVRFGEIEGGVLVVDALLLVALLAVMLHADRFWTVWIVALQALGTGAHAARAVDPTVARMAYAILVAAWSYPMILLLAIGTMRHRHRIEMDGTDVDWSFRARRRPAAMDHDL